jgi:hypothetical protein
MATQHPDLFAALAAPFAPNEVKVRGQAGRQLHYITARTAMNRLDEVLGPENWWDRYAPGENSVLCELSIRLPDGAVLTKCDAGGYAGMADQGDDDKSGYSDAFKRACVKFGIARYLYRDGVPPFVRAIVNGVDTAAPDDSEHEAAAPPSPAPAPRTGPDRTKPRGQWGPNPPHAAPPADADADAAPAGVPPAPRTGRALFAWLKDTEQRTEVGLLKYVSSWAKLQEFPGRMIDWNGDQVALAHAEALRKLAAYEESERFQEQLS